MQRTGDFWPFLSPSPHSPLRDSTTPNLHHALQAKGRTGTHLTGSCSPTGWLLGHSPSRPSALSWRPIVWWTHWEARRTISYQAPLETFALFSTSGQQSLSSRCALDVLFSCSLNDSDSVHCECRKCHRQGRKALCSDPLEVSEGLGAGGAPSFLSSWAEALASDSHQRQVHWANQCKLL